MHCTLADSVCLFIAARVQVCIVFVAAMLQVTTLKDRAAESTDELQRLQEQLQKLEDKFNDLMNNSRHSMETSQAAVDQNTEHRNDVQQITSIVEQVDCQPF